MDYLSEGKSLSLTCALTNLLLITPGGDPRGGAVLCCLSDANGELQLLPEPGAAWVVGSRGCKIREVGREHGKERVGVSAALPQQKRQKSISATKSQSPGEARCCSGKGGCSCAEPACHPGARGPSPLTGQPCTPG